MDLLFPFTKKFWVFTLQTWLDGGWVMVPLLVVSLLIFGVSINLFLHLRQRQFRHLSRDILAAWVAAPAKSKGETGEIIRYTQEGSCSMDEIHNRFSEVISARVPFYDRGLLFLKALVASAPLLGLLGTVMGMLVTFKGLSVGGGKLVDIIAQGISEALITTEMGLLIAIPGYFLAHAIQRRKEEYEAFLVQLESCTLQHFNKRLPK